MPPVDREYYVLQSEFYTDYDSSRSVAGRPALLSSYSNGLEENAQYVLFNGRDGALTDQPLLAKTGERVRIYFGNAGPNLVVYHFSQRPSATAHFILTIHINAC